MKYLLLLLVGFIFTGCTVHIQPSLFNLGYSGHGYGYGYPSYYGGRSTTIIYTRGGGW